MQESCPPPLEPPRAHESREGWGVVDYREKDENEWSCATSSVENAQDHVSRHDDLPTTPIPHLTS